MNRYKKNSVRHRLTHLQFLQHLFDAFRLLLADIRWQFHSLRPQRHPTILVVGKLYSCCFHSLENMLLNTNVVRLKWNSPGVLLVSKQCDSKIMFIINTIPNKLLVTSVFTWGQLPWRVV